MRALAATFAIALVSCGPAATTPPIAPEPAAAPADPPAAAVDKPAPLFAPIVASDREWTLTDGPELGNVLVVNLASSRSGDVTIARLTWTYTPRDGAPTTLENLPQVIAVGPRGVDIHESADDLDDDAVVNLLAEADHADPPAPEIGATSYKARLEKTDRGPIYCWGYDPPNEPDFVCEDTCYAHLCWSATDGLVRLGGTLSPDMSDLAQEGY